jgi:hypothetical protein
MVFYQVEKKRVLCALVWLVENNPFYSNITIDYNQIKSWEDRFVPQVLLDAAIITENDSSRDQHEGYTTSLEDGAYKNDFDTIHRDVEPGSIMGGTFLSDEMGQNHDKEIAFVAKLAKIVKVKEDDEAIEIPHIEFATSRPNTRLAPKNSY